MITDYVISTIRYIENNLQVEAIGAIIIIVLILLVLVSIIFLAFRNVRLWYWRINEQIKALEKIDKNLESIKESLPENLSIEETVTLTEAEPLKQIIPSKQEGIIETRKVDSLSETPKIVFDKKDKDERAIIKPGYNIGKTGKIYAEEVLRKKIQF